MTKERIPNKDGIPFLEYLKLNNLDLSEFDKYPERYKYATVDSLYEGIIYSGNFNFSENDLQEKPFITNDEILGFDENNAEIILKESTTEKFSELPYKAQFVLTINKTPVMNGYFEFFFSSEFPYDTFFLYFLQEEVEEFEVENKNHLRIAQGTKDEEYIAIPDFKTTNPTFYNTFLNRNKESNLFQE